MRLSKRTSNVFIPMLVGGMFLTVTPVSASADDCDKVSGAAETRSLPFELPDPPIVVCAFLGSGTITIGEEAFLAAITTSLLGPPQVEPDGTLIVGTSHNFDFGSLGTFTTIDDAKLIPTDTPGVFRLKTDLVIQHEAGTGVFEGAGGTLKIGGGSEITLPSDPPECAGGVATFELKKKICFADGCGIVSGSAKTTLAVNPDWFPGCGCPFGTFSGPSVPEIDGDEIHLLQEGVVTNPEFRSDGSQTGTTTVTFTDVSDAANTLETVGTTTLTPEVAPAVFSLVSRSSTIVGGTGMFENAGGVLDARDGVVHLFTGAASFGLVGGICLEEVDD